MVYNCEYYANNVDVCVVGDGSEYCPMKKGEFPEACTLRKAMNQRFKIGLKVENRLESQVTNENL